MDMWCCVILLSECMYSIPSLIGPSSSVIQKWPYKRCPLLMGNNLLVPVFYYLSTSEIWPEKGRVLCHGMGLIRGGLLQCLISTLNQNIKYCYLSEHQGEYNPASLIFHQDALKYFKVLYHYKPFLFLIS